MKQTQKGFTLIELMISLAIVAMLVAIAYPAYNDYVVRSRRAEAKRALVTAAQFLERRYSTQNTYLNDLTSSTPVALPTNMTCAPECGARQTHTIAYSTLIPPTQNSFVLVATAIGGQLEGETRLMECISFTLDNFGQRRAYSDTASSVLNQRCW